ncbi:MAG: hypothetical protein E7316_03560 [Clostridiales bacterium]|nr:hypothetical protein [Clostridiales bacterium]
MNAVVQLLEKVLPVFVLLGLGVLCRTKQLLTREGVNALKNVAVNIALPAVMFSAFADAEYTARSICVPLMIFLLCILSLYAGMALCRWMKIPGRLSPFLSAGFEAGMLGYSLFAILFPGEEASFAMVDLGQVLFVFTVYKVLLARKDGLKGALKEAASSTTVWAIVAGLLFGVTGLYRALQPSGISGVIDATADFIAAPTSALILLAIGYDLAPAQIKWKKISRLLLLRLGVSGAALAVALLVDRFVFGGMMHLGAALLLFILPPPYVLPVFADVEEERTDVSSALSALTVVSIALFAVLAAVM